MESALINMLEMELKCPVCLDIFSDPVSLPCRHHFCRECINTALTMRCPLGRCPICMRTYRRKPNLLENIHLVNLVNQYQNLRQHRRKHCVRCRSQPGGIIAKVCLTCIEPCCAAHVDEHLSSPSSHPGHLMVNIDELDGWTCSEHGAYRTLYCEDEQITVCRFCSRSTCSNHTVCNVNEKSSEMKGRLFVLERDLNIFNLVIHEELKEMKKDLKDMVEMLHALKSQVKAHYEKLQSKALQVLADFEENYTLTHNQHYQDIKLRRHKIRNLLSSTSMCLKQADKLKFLKRGNFHQKLITHGNAQEKYVIPPFRMNPPNLPDILAMTSERERKRKALDEPSQETPECSSSLNPPAHRKQKVQDGSCGR